MIGVALDGVWRALIGDLPGTGPWLLILGHRERLRGGG